MLAKHRASSQTLAPPCFPEQTSEERSEWPTGSKVDFVPGAEPGARNHMRLLLSRNSQLSGKHQYIYTTINRDKGTLGEVFEAKG